MEEFFLSPHFNDDLQPLSGAFEVLQRLKRDFTLHIVTARQAKLEQTTRRWLQRYFPDTFESIHFGNHYGGPGDRIRSKYEMCADINALCLIDDSPNYVFNCMRHNLRAFIFGDYAWNHDKNLPAAMVQEGYSVEMFPLTDADGGVGGDDNKIYRLKDWTQVESAVRHYFSRTSETKEDEITRRAVKKEDFVVAVVQLTSVNDSEANFRKIETLVEAAAAGASSPLDLVCLPEAALFLGDSADETLSHAQSLEEPLFHAVSETQRHDRFVARLGRLAQKHNTFLSVGGFPELIDSDIDGTKHRMANTHVIIGRDGQLLSHRYRKIHLFDCPFVALYESRLTAPGTEVVSVDLDGWRVGLTVCYDLRFPALFESLRDKHNVDVVLVPSAFTVPTGEAHWEVLLRARAIENQIYVVAAAQTGKHNSHRESYGHSLVVDPWGRLLPPLANVVVDDKASGSPVAVQEHVQIVRLTKQGIRETRDKMPVHDHRRPDLYH